MAFRNVLIAMPLKASGKPSEPAAHGRRDSFMFQSRFLHDEGATFHRQA